MVDTRTFAAYNHSYKICLQLEKEFTHAKSHE